MKRTIALLLFGLVAAAVAGSPSWRTDYKDAMTYAQKDNKALLILFTSGNDACNQLQQNVFASKTFIYYANENLSLMQVICPEQGKATDDLPKQTKTLMKKFNVTTCPFMVILDFKGNLLGTLSGYNGKSAREVTESIRAIALKGKKITSKDTYNKKEDAQDLKNAGKNMPKKKDAKKKPAKNKKNGQK